MITATERIKALEKEVKELKAEKDKLSVFVATLKKHLEELSS